MSKEGVLTCDGEANEMTTDCATGEVPIKLAFVGHRTQVGEWAALARQLSKSASITSDLWVLDNYDLREGVGTGAFDRVVHLLNGFCREESDNAAYTRAVRNLAELEQEDGKVWFHEDAASDRSMTGATDPGVALYRIRSRWHRSDIARMAWRVHEAVSREIAAEKITVVIGETNTLPYRIVYRACVRAGAVHLRPDTSAHLDGRVHFEEELDARWKEAVHKYKAFATEPVPNEARIWAEQRFADIRHRHLRPTPSPMVPRRLWERLRLSSARASLDAWRTAHQRDSFNSPRGVSPEIVSPIAKARRAVELEIRRRYYEKITTRTVPSERYAAYFFHVQPEFTVENLAFAFQDQVAHVRNLVAALPASTVLVVKEHRPIAGIRSLEYYAELASIPNVVVLHDSVDAIEVIKGADVIFTLTGTVALEAMCIGRPVVLFGDIYYDMFDGVYRPNSSREVQRLLGTSVSLEAASPADAIRALAARYTASYPGTWPAPPDSQKAVAGLAAALIMDLKRRRLLGA
jgi:hypothetical protein